MVGFDGNRDGRFVKGGLKLVSGVLNIVVSGNGGNFFGGGGFACSISTSVSVVSFELEWVFLDVLESVVHESSIASVVVVCSTGAVNKLLFREGFEGSVLEEISGFDGTGGGESPA